MCVCVDSEDDTRTISMAVEWFRFDSDLKAHARGTASVSVCVNSEEETPTISMAVEWERVDADLEAYARGGGH